MNATLVTVVGTAAADPHRRRVDADGLQPVEFPLRSTSRRYDRESGAWRDGDVLDIRVLCRRDLGEHVLVSVHERDPVLARGRLRLRAHHDPDTGERRVHAELDADAVGHDLASGTTLFLPAAAARPVRTRPSGTVPYPEFDLSLTGVGVGGPAREGAELP